MIRDVPQEALREQIRKSNGALLGPLFYRFCYKLYLAQCCQPENSTMLLFLSRGGIRLRLFYEAFLSANGLRPPCPYQDFYVSRMALIKAGLMFSYERVKGDFLSEYSHFTVRASMEAFLQPDQYQKWRELDPCCDVEEVINGEVMDELFRADGAGPEYLREVLKEEFEKYKKYLSDTVAGHRNLILVDTGWSGSILKYMRALDDDAEYTAWFFGRYNYTKADPDWFSHVVGLEVQNHSFDRRKPITSIFLNRHLIEGLCEIRWPSVTGYRRNPGGEVESYEGFAPASSVVPDDSEPHAQGILLYLQSAQNGMNYEAINHDANKAARQLCRRLMYPSKRDLPLFSVLARSADFGKNLDVPFFLEPVKPGYRLKAKVRACRESLWPTGQMAIEFGAFRLVAQFFSFQVRVFRIALRRLRLI